MDIYDLDDCIDTSWIDNFNSIEKDYDNYYKISPKKVNIIIFFINTNNEIINIKKDNITLDHDKCVNKKDFLEILYNNKTNKYKLYSILKYNFTIEPKEIKNLFKNELEGKQFLFPQSKLTDIKIEDTIQVFEDINVIYIFLKEKIQNKLHLRKTKRNIKGNIKFKKSMSRRNNK
jgi:hypothetical protein